ncbi:metallophosphoesterase family protein [Methylobacterium symbioticum]|mgnify:CR=1 FL=1|uniref:3',5'-cyclic-AMP phosphodiesterase n=3 Tax=Methylobacterium TaxID=407 RepID=A0A509E970_9HYPH|nr:metallophosphoesterase [Methylobacterium symbioticum]VUD70214.1 hypothetical protein MET9862_00777 [Methylobacterium symbioticum]
MPVADETLYRLLQVSDLHFGNIPAGQSTASSAPSPRLIGLNPLFDGQLGHHAAGVLALNDFHARLRRRCEGFDMVVTGDVTANGAVGQFDLAGSFLGAGPSQFGFQLGRSDWADTGISGNHDQWNGNNSMIGGPTQGLARHLPQPMPRVRARILPDETMLKFLFIDTDADVSAFSPNRILGRGAFHTQLQALEGLPPIGEREIRVLVMHHSVVGPVKPIPDPSRPGVVQITRGGRRRMMEIADFSMRLLNHFIVDKSISVVLSGHMHVALLSELVATNGPYTRRYLEARCGSTTQRDRFEYKDLKGMPQARALRPNTLLMHEIVREQGNLVWKSVVHWLAPAGRFVPLPPANVPAPATPGQVSFVLS